MTHKSLAAALVAAQAKMKDPRLTGTNPHFKSKFVPRDEALDCILATANAEGLAVCQPPCSSEQGVGVRTILMHADSGESFDFGPFCVTPSKPDPQGEVAATTYASRTALMLIFGRAGDEDDDGNGASGRQEPWELPAEAAVKALMTAANAAKKDAPARRAAIREALSLGDEATSGELLEAYQLASTDLQKACFAIANGTIPGVE